MTEHSVCAMRLFHAISLQFWLTWTWTHSLEPFCTFHAIVSINPSWWNNIIAWWVSACVLFIQHDKMKQIISCEISFYYFTHIFAMKYNKYSLSAYLPIWFHSFFRYGQLVLYAHEPFCALIVNMFSKYDRFGRIKCYNNCWSIYATKSLRESERERRNRYLFNISISKFWRLMLSFA